MCNIEYLTTQIELVLVLPTFKFRTFRKIMEYLTLALLSSLWNAYHCITAYFFDPPWTHRVYSVGIPRTLCRRRRQLYFHSLISISTLLLPLLWYDTRCYFNVRSKADISELNLPHACYASRPPREIKQCCNESVRPSVRLSHIRTSVAPKRRILKLVHTAAPDTTKNLLSVSLPLRRCE